MRIYVKQSQDAKNVGIAVANKRGKQQIMQNSNAEHKEGWGGDGSNV